MDRRVPTPIFAETMPKEGFVRCQDDRPGTPAIRGVRHEVAAAAYVEYARQYGTSQSFERLHERGGFSIGEIVSLLTEATLRG